MKETRTPMDLMDDIYSLAYCLTGSGAAANELVNRTYLNIDRDTPEREVFRIFGECYFDSYAHEKGTRFSKPVRKPLERLVASLLDRDEDIKLSVLLSEISGLKHRATSKIIGKPLDTKRVWLSTKRKLHAERRFAVDNRLLLGVSIKRDGAL